MLEVGDVGCGGPVISNNFDVGHDGIKTKPLDSRLLYNCRKERCSLPPAPPTSPSTPSTNPPKTPISSSTHSLPHPNQPGSPTDSAEIRLYFQITVIHKRTQVQGHPQHPRLLSRSGLAPASSWAS